MDAVAFDATRPEGAEDEEDVNVILKSEKVGLANPSDVKFTWYWAYRWPLWTHVVVLAHDPQSVASDKLLWFPVRTLTDTAVPEGVVVVVVGVPQSLHPPESKMLDVKLPLVGYLLILTSSRYTVFPDFTCTPKSLAEADPAHVPVS